MTTRLRARWLPVLAAIVAFALVAASCGGGDSDSTSEDPASDAETDDQATDDEPADDGGDAETSDDGSETPAPAEGGPRYGGEISVLVEAETQTWDLPNAECAESCITVMRLVADALFAIDESGAPQPMLLESATHNDDFTEWTLTLRENIEFHDGTPVNADALKLDLDSKAASLLHGQVLTDLDTTTIVDDRTVTVTFVAPFSDFPELMSDRVGFVMAPSFYDDPDRALNGPVGTGAFLFSDWVPDDRLVLERNSNYWRTDAEGQQLPYLDRVVVRPVPNTTDREAIIQAGDGTIGHISNTENPDQWTDGWDGGLLTEEPLTKQVSYLQFNNSVPPFDDLRARQAIALCSDLPTFNQLRNPASQTANGPFAPGVPGHLEDTGFPAFDPEAGRALVDEIGGLSVEYLTTDDSGNLLNAQVFAQQWDSNCGIETAIRQVDQGELISAMLVGSFNLIQTRNHGSIVPSMEYIWWHSRHSNGLPALNFSRFQDDAIDAALDAMRATDDAAERAALAEDISRAFGEGVYNVWYSWTEWWHAYQPELQGLGVMSLPDGGLANPWRGGIVWLTEAWLDA